MIEDRSSSEKELTELIGKVLDFSIVFSSFKSRVVGLEHRLRIYLNQGYILGLNLFRKVLIGGDLYFF